MAPKVGSVIRDFTQTPHHATRTPAFVHRGRGRSRSASTWEDVPQFSHAPPWRPMVALNDWVRKEAKPISLKQLTFFGRTLTKERLIQSAVWIREELPIRLAHRLREMQLLPFSVMSNKHIAHVYERYYSAFETFRRVPPIETLEDNDSFCQIVSRTLEEHLTVIPKLTMGVLECQATLDPEATDRFMTNMLRARISRRVIAEQHIALTQSLKDRHAGKTKESGHGSERSFVGEVFPKCNAAEVVISCKEVVGKISRQTFGRETRIPEVLLTGDLAATFPYIPSHLEYIIGEILRNSFSATFERHGNGDLPPVEVLIVESPNHVLLRFSDQGGGLPRDILPTLWSFGKGPRSQTRLENLSHVPRMAATIEELNAAGDEQKAALTESQGAKSDASLGELAGRPPGLRLGMGLPLSRVYAEYWAGSLSLQNVEGYGADVFLQISKLGNNNEQFLTRASMDAI